MYFMTQIFYRMFLRSVIFVMMVLGQSESAIACGKFEYVTNTRTCRPCRICPININNAQSRFISDCNVSSPSWLHGRFIGCGGRHDPVPWCEPWSDKHGNVTCVNGNMTIGSICTLQCANGYVVDVDDPSSQCTGNLTWLPAPKPVCRPKSSRNNHTKNGPIDKNGEIRSFNDTEIDPAKEVIKDDPRYDKWYIIGVSSLILMILGIIITVILCKKFKLSPSKIKEKLCDSPPDRPLVKNDGSKQPLTVELTTEPHNENKTMVPNRQPNGVIIDANMFGVDALTVPEITEENADARQLIKVFENTRVMEGLREYFDCKEEKYRVTWHVIAREVLHMQGPAIKNLEYHRKGDFSNGPFIAIMEKMKGNGVSLKHFLDFLFEFRSNVSPLREVDYKDINIIIDLLLEFVKKDQ